MSAKRYVTPKDKFGEEIENALPAATAVARSVNTLTEPVAVELNDETRLITVYAIAKDVFVHWASDSEDQASNENFDEVVVAGTQAIMEVPEKADGTRFTVVSVAGRESGATAIVIEK